MTPDEELAWLAIRENIGLARAFVGDLSSEAFAHDRRTFYAVTRCLEIISEAARPLRGPLQERFPNIEWLQIEDSGNVFRHAYQQVVEERVWLTVRERPPALLEAAELALLSFRG